MSAGSIPAEDGDRMHLYDTTVDALLAGQTSFREAHAAGLRAVVEADRKQQAAGPEGLDAWPFEK